MSEGDKGHDAQPLAGQTDAGVSRRAFLRLNAALLALAGTTSCHWRSGSVDARTRLHLLRADDLLALQIDLTNLQILTRRRSPSRLVRIRPDQAAFLTVRLPGQSIAEQCFRQADTGEIALPVGSAIARPTTLAFEIPGDIEHIELTIDALLNWQAWRPVTLAGSNTSATRIEAPAGLVLAPPETASWQHATRPVTYAGRTELWHTRLSGEQDNGASLVHIQHPGYDTRHLDDLQSALGAEERDQLIGNKATARTLILSPMGGWLDLYGRWETGKIARWEHKATAGQDQRVVIQREDGFLFPFGHRATAISVTERELGTARSASDGTQRVTALLRKRFFIAIKQPTVSYPHGHMAVQSLTATTLVTPPLQEPATPDGPFWAQIDKDRPYLFRFTATDWAGNAFALSAPAVFSVASVPAAHTRDTYRHSDRARWRRSHLAGQSVVVAAFDSRNHPDTDRWGTPLAQPRSAGNTTLQLLQLEFDGDPTRPVDDGAAFSCLTDAMLARLPSLAPYLPEARNQGWFDYLNPAPPDPMDNRGEIFARARADSSARIPMAFDEQSDRCGAVATPSYLVDGVSRVFGPVSNAGSLARGDDFRLSDYFSKQATLLNAFALKEMFRDVVIDGTVSPQIPKITLSLAYEQPASGAKPSQTALWKATAALVWKIALPAVKAGPIRFGHVGKDSAQLVLDAKTIKTFDKKEPDKKPADPDDKATEQKQDSNSAQKTTPVDWSVTGKMVDFAIALEAFEDTSLIVEFKELGIKLGPPKKKNKPRQPPAPDDPPKPDDDPSQLEKDTDKDKDASISAERVLKLGEIRGSGLLSFINPLMDIGSKIPQPPDFNYGDAAPVFPASLPGTGDADIAINLGPIEAPRFNWLQFEVSNIRATFGIGLYVFPRKGGALPDNLFTLRVASADKPMTLMAEPWAGTAFIAVNFTNKGLTGFQFSAGLVYRVSLNFTLGEARCEGAVNAIYHYEIAADGSPHDEVGMVMRLFGGAQIGGWINISLSLVAIGKWDDSGWLFFAEIAVRVQISFFAISVRAAFSYQLPNPGNDRAMLGSDQCVNAGQLTKQQWHNYQDAFARDT